MTSQAVEPSLQRWPRVKTRLRASLIHLTISGLVAALSAALVFFFWYPMPYREAAGGRELFLLVLSVDVVLGPLLTLVVFDPRKPRRELVRDLATIAVMQLAGLVYGLYTVERARPAVVALERDRLRVVRSIDIKDEDFEQGPAGLNHRSWTGPLYVATRAPRPDEKLDAIESGLAGTDIGARPRFWLPPEQTAAAWAAGAKPLADLRRMHMKQGAVIDSAAAATGQPEASLAYLPIIARRVDITALLEGATGKVVGYVPLDGHR